MEIIADLHIHSRHSRATSKNLSIENLEKYGKMKGIGLLGTGDFQHPEYRKEIDEKLIEGKDGILRTKNGYPFILQTEISFMFTQNGKGRAVHLVMLCPNKKTADKITKYLLSKGRIDYDGRPIFGIACKDFVKDMKAIDDKIEIIPAHCMTPWFGLFGSKKGFDSLEECFEEQTKHIYAIESGMSADPIMLWRFKEKVNIVSFSDCHSFWPWRIGREATILEIKKLSYDNIIGAIRTGKGIKATIETPPQYGIYHWDGHRKCDFSCGPKKTKELDGKCPKCGRALTLGVDYRVEDISKEDEGYKPKNAKPYFTLLPLHELISLHVKMGMPSAKVWGIYNNLIENFKDEFNILLHVSKKELIKKNVDKLLIDLILKNRKGKIKVKPGYDGVYGKARLEE
jgi:uncharacterized protein (TIGR00375 family)